MEPSTDSLYNEINELALTARRVQSAHDAKVHQLICKVERLEAALEAQKSTTIWHANAVWDHQDRAATWRATAMELWEKLQNSAAR